MLALPIVPSAPEAVVTAPRPTLKWYQVWLYALVPSVEGYRRIAADDNSQWKKGLLWLTLVNVVVSAAAAFVQGFLPSRSDSGPDLFRALMLAAMMCFSGFFLTALELVFLPAVQFVLTLAMRGKGKLETQLYLYCAFTSPLRSVVFFLTSIVAMLLQLPDTYDTLIYLVAPIVVYSMVLNTIATKVTFGVGWIRATIPSLITYPLTYTGCLFFGSI